MGITNHAFERISSRLTELGLNIQQIFTLRKMAENAAKRSNAHSEAIRLLRVAQQHNVPWSDVSNGNEVWAIIRQKDLVTVMFRRETQPKTAESFRVEKVTILY